MTAEHDFPGGPPVPDPLMAVIADEPLPEAARADAGLLAEHRSAAADVAVLREQLGLIGDALARAPEDAEDAATKAAGPAVAPVRPAAASRPPRARRRPFALALGGLAVACAATFVSGLAWLLLEGGGSADGSGADKSAAQADSKEEAAGGLGFGSPRYLACARLVVEGTVTGVEPVPGAGRSRVTLDVARQYKPEKPAKAGDPLVFQVEDNTLDEPLRVGDYALVGFPRDGLFPDAVFTHLRDIAVERAWIERSLPRSRSLTCPGT